MVALIEDTIIDLERGKLAMPPDVDPKVFILTGGKVLKKPELIAAPVENMPESATVASIFDTYAKTLTPGSKELNSIATESIHGRHFKRVLVHPG